MVLLALSNGWLLSLNWIKIERDVRFYAFINVLRIPNVYHFRILNVIFASRL